MQCVVRGLSVLLALGGCATPVEGLGSHDKEGFDFSSPVPGLEDAPARELVVDSSNHIDLRVESVSEGTLDPQRHHARWFTVYDDEVARAESRGESLVLYSAFDWDWHLIDYVGQLFDRVPDRRYSATQRVFYRVSADSDWILLTEHYDGSLESVRAPLRDAGDYLIVVTALGTAYEDSASFEHVVRLTSETAELAPPRDVVFSLRTASSWRAVAGVRISVGTAEAVTDADGHAVLRGLSPGLWAVKLGPSGFLRGDRARIDVLNKPGALGLFEMFMDDAQYECLEAGGMPDRFAGGCRHDSAD